MLDFEEAKKKKKCALEDPKHSKKLLEKNYGGWGAIWDDDDAPAAPRLSKTRES